MDRDQPTHAKGLDGNPDVSLVPAASHPEEDEEVQIREQQESPATR